jgi:hypothetical protein
VPRIDHLYHRVNVEGPPDFLELRCLPREHGNSRVKSVMCNELWMIQLHLSGGPGALLARTSFGWPLVIGGTLKAAYGLLLLAQFRSVAPREAGVR